MALTNAERVALWRQRQKQDPQKNEIYKMNERNRYKMRKEKGSIKSIKDMSQREQRDTRRNWRRNQSKKRKRDIIFKVRVNAIPSPPTSPDGIDNRAETMKKVGRKQIHKDRSKAYRNITKLKVKLYDQTRLTELYRSDVSDC